MNTGDLIAVDDREAEPTPASAAPRPAPARRPRRFRQRLVSVHRWLSLGMAALWLFQAVTGALIVFHWEIADAAVSAPHAATDLAALGRRIERLAPPGSGRHVAALWTSAGFHDRYDIHVIDARTGGDTVVRVSGDGTPIHVSRPGAVSLIDTIVLLHQTLLGGDRGRWIIGASGLLLVSNLTMGLVVAWPRRGTWRKSLTPARRGQPIAGTYSWHRALGLTGAAAALLLITPGALLAFDAELRPLLNAVPVTVPASPGPSAIGFAQAVEAAESAVPGSRLTAVTMPGAEDATYQVRLRAPGDWQRAYGGSVVFVDAASGRIRGIDLAGDAPPARKAMDMLFPIHTGQAGAGRCGCWCSRSASGCRA
ncbi:MAG TPA: PepSY-associated TM helix domain-containing protein [Sphingomonas sp.]|nr:PepSY-associated TM helix domain-containing protein [Sphingomonas sp.]